MFSFKMICLIRKKFKTVISYYFIFQIYIFFLQNVLNMIKFLKNFPMVIPSNYLGPF